MTLLTKGILVLQHIACEPPALYEDVLRARGIPITRIEVDEGDPIPDPRTFAAVVAMGGPMSAYDDDTLPWLQRERTAIRQAVDADLPFWGVCLGAQMLASALGAEVRPGSYPEVGIGQVATTGSAVGDPVFRSVPRLFPALQWHSDTFDLPAGSVLLASSDSYPNQAFTYRRAYGLQFHLEVTPDLMEQWARVPAYAESLHEVRGPGALDQLIDEVATNAYETAALAKTMFTHWLDRVVEPREGSPTPTAGPRAVSQDQESS